MSAPQQPAKPPGLMGFGADAAGIAQQHAAAVRPPQAGGFADPRAILQQFTGAQRPVGALSPTPLMPMPAASPYRPVADPRQRVIQALAQRGLDTGFR